MIVTKQAERFANALLEMPRGENDIEIAALLHKMSKIYEVAHEMVHANTYEKSKAAYVEMINLIKGNQIEDRQTKT
jgi:hypothetical protein